MDENQPIEERLKAQADAAPAARYERRFRAAARLLAALRRRSFPMEEISPFIDELDRAARETDSRAARTVYAKLVEHIEKEHDLVLPDHYQNQWMAIGVSIGARKDREARAAGRVIELEPEAK